MVQAPPGNRASRKQSEQSCQLFLWLAIPAAILAGLAWLSTTVSEAGVPGWVPWVCGAVAYLLILRCIGVTPACSSAVYGAP
jgi:hypothetical protein